MLGYGAILSTERLGTAPIPTRLSGVPFGEDLGIVFAVKEVPLRKITAPFKPEFAPNPLRLRFVF